MSAENEFEITKGDAPSIVAELARKLQIPLEVDCKKGFMHLPAVYGEGMVAAYHTNKGLDSIIFDCTLAAPLTLHLTGNNTQPIYLYTAAQANVEVACDAGRFSVEPLQAVIHGSYGSGRYTIKLPAQEPIVLMISLVHRKVFFKEIDCGVIQVPAEFLRVIKGDDLNEDQFLFDDIYHLPAIDTVNSIISQTDIGLLHSAHASAQIYENMFLLINEYKRINAGTSRRLIRDRKKIELIRRAEKILVSRIQEPPTIPILAKMVGINQQTLKTGFRQLYGSTINTYLNDRRLEQAGMLINGGDLSIGEVANAVGYSNGGYFSRKFKQKYGVTPSKFGMEA